LLLVTVDVGEDLAVGAGKCHLRDGHVGLKKPQRCEPQVRG
jgi:hypothetical protein